MLSKLILIFAVFYLSGKYVDASCVMPTEVPASFRKMFGNMAEEKWEYYRNKQQKQLRSSSGGCVRTKGKGYCEIVHERLKEYTGRCGMVNKHSACIYYKRVGYRGYKRVFQFDNTTCKRVSSHRYSTRTRRPLFRVPTTQQEARDYGATALPRRRYAGSGNRCTVQVMGNEVLQGSCELARASNNSTTAPRVYMCRSGGHTEMMNSECKFLIENDR